MRYIPVIGNLCRTQSEGTLTDDGGRLLLFLRQSLSFGRFV